MNGTANFVTYNESGKCKLCPIDLIPPLDYVHVKAT